MKLTGVLPAVVVSALCASVARPAPAAEPPRGSIPQRAITPS